MKKFECHITITINNSTAIAELSQHCDLSSSALKSAIAKGALWLTKGNKTQRFRRIKKPLNATEQLHFYYDENILSQSPAPAELVADLTDYSIWYKPYGMLSQGTKWSDHCSIARWVQQNLPNERQVYIVHRLDRAATGLIIVAHTKAAVKALTTMFEKREDAAQLEKHYEIIVHGHHNLRPQPDIITADVDGKSAKSTFTSLAYDQEHDLSLVSVKIDTGRKHQIRAHAASINMPVVGDRLHGAKNYDYCEALNLQLSAVMLSFICPLSGEKKEFKLRPALRPQLKKVIELMPV